MSVKSTPELAILCYRQHFGRIHYTVFTLSQQRLHPAQFRRAKHNLTMSTPESKALIASNSSRLLSILLRSVLVLLLSAPIIILLLSVQTGPSVVMEQAITGPEISQIESLLIDEAPQSPGDASVQEIALNAQELNLLLRYAIDVMNLSSNWAAQLTLNQAALETDLSVKIPGNALPLFLNIHGGFVADEGLLKLNSLSVGKLQIPDRLLQYTVAKLAGNLRASNSAYLDFSDLLDNVESVEVSDNRMQVSMYWDPVLVARIGDNAQQMFISDADQQRIISYYQLIAEVATTIPSDIRAVSLNTFLVPLFAAAHNNSLAGNDAIAESRTVFQALAAYINQEPIERLLGADLTSEITPARYIEVRLQRRQDLAQHLVSIAAITASAGADLAQLLSTTKEAYDARYRSGFSFSDLTANSVGVTMARLATSDAATAQQMQLRISQIQNESEYMPQVGNNRDGLSESDFNTQFTNRDSAQYQARVLEIQNLIDTRPLFSGMDLR